MNSAPVFSMMLEENSLVSGTSKGGASRGTHRRRSKCKQTQTNQYNASRATAIQGSRQQAGGGLTRSDWSEATMGGRLSAVGLRSPCRMEAE
jgi:hypothetical protein